MSRQVGILKLFVELNYCSWLAARPYDWLIELDIFMLCVTRCYHRATLSPRYIHSAWCPTLAPHVCVVFYGVRGLCAPTFLVGAAVRFAFGFVVPSPASAGLFGLRRSTPLCLHSHPKTRTELS